MWWPGRRTWTRATGDEEWEGCAVANLKKAREKVKKKDDNISHMERSVRRMEDIVAKEANVKEEVVDEVLEVEVEETMEEKVKEKVVEEKPVGAGQWLRIFFAGRRRGVHPGPAM